MVLIGFNVNMAPVFTPNDTKINFLLGVMLELRRNQEHQLVDPEDPPFTGCQWMTPTCKEMIDPPNLRMCIQETTDAKKLYKHLP